MQEILDMLRQTVSQMPARKPYLGPIRVTRGLAKVTTEAFRMECLERHANGDWGTMCDADKKDNDDRLRTSIRPWLMSSYELPQPVGRDKELWIVTNHSGTTLYLPSEN